jgi:hypothetical protein
MATLALTVVAGTAGCSGSSAKGSSSVVAGDTPASGATTSTAATTATSGAPAAASTQPSAATGGNGSAPSGTSTTSSSARRAPAPVATKAPGRPTGYTQPGTYSYAVSGTATSPFGGKQNLDGTSSYVVDPPQGNEQHSKTSGKNGSQDSTLAVRSSGLYVVDIHITSPGFDEDFKPVGTALYFPASYRTGSHWSWHAKSSDGKFALDVASKISGTATQAVGGQSLKTLVVDTSLRITGTAVDLTSQQRDWVSMTYALVTKEHNVTNGKAYGTTVSSDATRTLRSTRPS